MVQKKCLFKPLLKGHYMASRTVMRQKWVRFPFTSSASGSKERVPCCLENLCGRTVFQKTTINPLPEHVYTIYENLYESEKRSFIRQTTHSHASLSQAIVTLNLWFPSPLRLLLLPCIRGIT